MRVISQYLLVEGVKPLRGPGGGELKLVVRVVVAAGGLLHVQRD